MIYQDTWINGKMIEKGTRSCEARYQIIKSFCNENKPVSILDIGANMCYFGLRLIEDFGCSVMAFEYDHFELRMANVKNNRTKNLMLLNRKLSIPDLGILATCCHFDLVLALSVMHHLPGDSAEWFSMFKQLGDNIIIEFALTDSKRPAVRIPEGGRILGYGNSHLKKDFKRPIILYEKAVSNTIN